MFLLPLLLAFSPPVCTPTYYRFDLLRQHETFLIHGLWIEQCKECLSCGYPSYCPQSTCDIANDCHFNISELAPIKDELDKYWFNGTNLLQHEYCKHGTCTNLTEYEYFATALKIYKTLDLDKCDYSKKECWFYFNST
jgi:ribonuclease I